MGLFNKKLSSLASACRRIAGCNKEEQPSPRRQDVRVPHAGLYLSKFPSRQRNYAVRRRRRNPDNNNSPALAAIGLVCQACDRQKQLQVIR